jgi:hypothetical protein
MSARRPSAPASRGPESPARQRRAPQRHPGEESSSAADESDDALPVPQYSSADDDDDDASLSSLLSTESIAAPLLDEQFLPRLVAVFWAVFHPTEGPKVVYQVPDGAVVPQAQAQPPLVPPRLSSSRPASPRRAAAPSAAAPAPPPLFDWAALKDYLIPKEPLCGHLVTCLASAAALEPGTPTHPGAYGAQAFKVLAYPVLMHDEDKYARNTFIFNLAFVFDAKSDVRAYEPVVRKCARTLRYLEVSRGAEKASKAACSPFAARTPSRFSLRLARSRACMGSSSSCTRTSTPTARRSLRCPMRRTRAISISQVLTPAALAERAAACAAV